MFWFLSIRGGNSSSIRTFYHPYAMFNEDRIRNLIRGVPGSDLWR